MHYYGLEVVSRAIAHKKQSVGRCARRRVLEANRSPERLQTKTGPFSGTGKHLRMFGQRMVMVVVISNRGRCAQGNGIGHGVQRQSQDDAAHHIKHRMLL